MSYGVLFVLIIWGVVKILQALINFFWPRKEEEEDGRIVVNGGNTNLFDNQPTEQPTKEVNEVNLW